jgi:hypothetical protein
MQFYLGFQPEISQQKITHNDDVLLIGSCFSEHIGNCLSEFKFQVHSNPFGIVFNPKSIETALNRIIEKNYFNENDVFEKESNWFSLEAHSSVFAIGKNELLKLLNSTIDEWNLKLKSASFLILTYGSAFAYKSKLKDKIVANCHKLPQAEFDKVLLETQEIVSDYQILIDKIKVFNPGLKILFTVSPVKHLRDGVVENSLSKAILIQSVHQLIKRNSNCVYFPAYELVNDDLRDYRFYESDMAHPNTQAINYVWKKFSDVYFNEITNSINEKVIQIHQAYHHRLFNKTTESSIKFKHKFYQKCVTLQSEFPRINLSQELHYFNTFED